ncbi:MAG: hypothetical protein IJY25_04990 [Bacilli bacterium]|nr:hypothetical protein [Bacilli bacterium]
MNNNQMNFDPMTGQPINNNQVSQQNIPIVGLEQSETVVQSQPQVTPTVQPQVTQQPVQTNTVIQQPMQNVPTVEQSKQDFINNTQALTPEKKEEKKNGVNYTFIIILFIAIFVAIFFLFPLLLDYI